MSGTTGGGNAPAAAFQGFSQRNAAGTPKNNSAMVSGVRTFASLVNHVVPRNSTAKPASSTAIGVTGKGTPYMAPSAAAGTA